MATSKWLQSVVKQESYLWGEAVSDTYHGAASKDMDHQWQWMIWPLMKRFQIDFTDTIDFAAGYGRNTRKLLKIANHVTAIDVNPDCTQALRSSFSDDPVTVIQNSGIDLELLASDAYSFVYSFDAMVHFDVALIVAYLPEFARVLRPGGHAFIHHSNFSGQPGADFRSNPHWRNYMTADLFKHIAVRSGFAVLDQKLIAWGEERDLDCITVLQKAATD